MADPRWFPGSKMRSDFSPMSNDQAPKISLVVFIDALGWEVLRGRRFMDAQLPFRRKLRSVFGFSSACIPRSSLG
jgi:hypothetical protein